MQETISAAESMASLWHCRTVLTLSGCG